ncbi:hypothetical protein [Streptomyces sp. NPDC017940]|uniref:hypothetical protein n=1 Tax=Streptomyces sp. NPDC017940 TaxID=3365017 RepID=UPI0037A881A3
MAPPAPAPAPFTVVMRDDTHYCVRRLTAWIARDTDCAAATLAAALTTGYQRFQAEVRAALHAAADRPERAEFHLVDASALERAVRHSAGGGGRVISLDPLVRRAVAPLRLSRGFLLGGTRSVGLVARPGARAIGEQLGALRARWGGGSCTLLDDDICTAETVGAAVRLLHTADITVSRIVSGIQFGTTERLRRAVTGVPVTPVIAYRYPDEREGAAARISLADPRNFLLGVSGLAVLLPDGTWGRAPYWLPFVRTAARVGLRDAHHDRPFALAMLTANARFYARVERQLRVPVRVRHLNPSVARLLCSLDMASPDTPVLTAVDTLRAGLDRYTETARSWEAAHARASARRLLP